MKAVVGVTDNDWAAFLRHDTSITEANFWTPSGRRFASLKPGEPFLFKTKAPDNRLVGGGFFDRFWLLPLSEAWAVFQEGNGVASEAELASKIQLYRARTRRPYDADPEIGCVILRNLFFAEPGGEFGPPPDWSPEIVTTKGYDLDSPAAAYVRFAYENLRSAPRLDSFYDADIRLTLATTSEDRYGEEYLTRSRLGQGSFKLVVHEAYADRCAITGTRHRPVLQAAHIRPYSQGGEHEVANGLLLRSDAHTLYDKGYLGIDRNHHLQVSPRLRVDTGNGEEFYRRAEAGDEIRMPTTLTDRPSPDALEWHMDTVFLSA